MSARWFRVPRIVRVLLLLPIVVGIEVALIVALFPPLPQDPIHSWLLLAALVLFGFVGADLPNASHIANAPSPYPHVAWVLEFLIGFALVAAESWAIAWLSFNWPHPQADQVFFYNRGAFALATIGIALALGHCEWWLRVNALMGSMPDPVLLLAERRSEATPVPKRVEAWQRDEAARARLSELRSDSALVRGALILVWPLLALMVALPVAALGVLLLPPDAMRTVLAALLSTSSIGLSFAFVFSALRLHRKDNVSREDAA